MDETWRPIHQANYEAVQRGTWGHLAPKKNRTYPGSMLFARSAYGECSLIRADFKGLNDSPWLFQVMNDFAEENAKEDGAIYRFIGHFRNYEFVGAVNKAAI
jgi:hypothetical protein